MSDPQDRGLTALPAIDRRADVRPATPDEVPTVAAAVRALLRELGATPPETAAMEDAARVLVEDPDAGAVLVADADGAVVGMLAASWQTAIHVPGRYGLIQDLWVHHEWRSRAIGHELVEALVDVATRCGITRIEVGIPRDGFPRLEATRRFYLRNDFAAIGGRLRRVLP